MTFTALNNRSRARHRARLWPLVLGAVAGVAALALVIYLLWPTWSGTSAEMADRFPITVGGTLFDVPRDAIRVSVQRRSGDQERVDLAFQYPSLTPPRAADARHGGDRRANTCCHRPHLRDDCRA